MQTDPIVIPSIEQSFDGRLVPEREHRNILVDDEVQPPQAVS